MAIDLNLASLVVAFLCFDQPMVIRVMAIIFVNGCSKEVNLKAASFICPKTAEPKGDTKYKIKPTNNWMWVPINAKSAIFLSLAVNSFFEDIPMNELTTAKTSNNNAK